MGLAELVHRNAQRDRVHLLVRDEVLPEALSGHLPVQDVRRRDLAWDGRPFWDREARDEGVLVEVARREPAEEHEVVAVLQELALILICPPAGCDFQEVLASIVSPVHVGLAAARLVHQVQVATQGLLETSEVADLACVFSNMPLPGSKR